MTEAHAGPPGDPAGHPPFSSRVEALSGEGAYRVLARAQALEAGGREIVHFEIGQPDTPTPPAVCEAGIRAIRDGRTRYTPPLRIGPLREAIAAWPEDLRVVLIASGGLSHFVIDEAFDHALIDAAQKRDLAWLRAIDEAQLQSGTSEVKNWLPVIAAASAAGMAMRVVDYVPCYRSEAGTGNAMGFVVWQPQRAH